MNRAVTSVLVSGLLLLMILSPFSALAMLFLFLFIGAVAWFVSSIVHVVLHHNPEPTEATDTDR